MIFHDAAHLSFFEEVESNRRLAEVMQYTVNYNFRYWESIHNSHHSHFGDSTVKDNSLTIVFSEQEMEQLPMPLRILHRVIRDPVVFYPVAGLFVFFLNKPLTHGRQRILIPLFVWATLGSQTLFWYMVAAWIAGMVGVACFHVQHHANSAYRVSDASQRSGLDAAVIGSTRVKVPFPLSVFSFGIEYHHIHHFDVRVPGYHLQQCDAEGEKLGLWKRVNTLSGMRVFKTLFHTHFEGSRKVADAETGELPRFGTFWPYSALGLQDA